MRGRVRGLAAAFGLAGVAVAGWLAQRPPPRAPVARPNLLVVDIDTLRADRVGATRAGAPVTPNLDALAARGVTFTHAIAPSGWTLPAITTLLTGSAPLPIPSPRAMPARAPGAGDLPGILRLYGYHDAAFWGGTLPGHVAGFLSTAFDEAQSSPRDAAPPTGQVLDFLDHAPEPFFAWVHQVDLHDPNTMGPGGAWVAPDDPSGVSYHEIYQRLLAAHPAAEAEARTLARYDSVLHAYDAEVGRIVARLEARGLLDRTVVVVSSDHGEDLFAHSWFDHGLLYDSTLRVPLLVVDPDGPAGVTVDTAVQGLDLAPTLLARAGAVPAAEMPGQSWLPLLHGAPGYTERPAFAVSEACHAALRTGTQKLIVRDPRPRRDRAWVEAGNGVVVHVSELGTFDLPACAAEADPVVEVYDLVADPEERHNLVDTRRATIGPALRVLLTLMRDAEARLAGQPRAPLSDAQVEAIRAQGYWGLVGGDGAAAPPDPSG